MENRFKSLELEEKEILKIIIRNVFGGFLQPIKLK